MAVSIVSFSFFRAAQPAAQRYRLSPPHLVTNGSPNTIGGPKGPFGLVWLSLPHLVSNSVRSLIVWLLVLTELYISSTPTQSLEWHVWLSSSGNNCHAVQRSLSSGASVYECIMAFTLSHFISQIRPRDLFRLLAIGMCHFLPAHHFEMACLAGSKVKIKHLKTELEIDLFKLKRFNAFLQIALYKAPFLLLLWQINKSQIIIIQIH